MTLTNSNNDASDPTSGMSGFMSGMSSLEEGMSGLEEGMSGLEEGMSGLEEGMSGLESGMSSLESGMSHLFSAMGRISQMVHLALPPSLATLLAQQPPPPRSRDRVTPSSSNDSAQYMPSSNPEAGHPDPSDGIVHRRVGSENWSEYCDRPSWATECRYGAETSFELDIGSADLFLVSRGLGHSGNINVVQSKNEGEKVGVNVKVGYHYKEALAIASVCLLERGKGGNGVGIFTSMREDRIYLDHKNNLKFKVTVTLPAGKDGGPLKIKKFTTDTPLFSYNVGDFLNSVFFGEITLETDETIGVEHITTQNGSFRSSGGDILGKFKASDVLKLETWSGAIVVDVDLLWCESAWPTELKVKTRHGDNSATVLLESSTGHGGAFKISSEAYIGPIAVEVHDSPMYSHLECTAHAVKGNVTVNMHPAFEGQFEVSTPNGRPVLGQYNPVSVEESVHMGRKRVIDKFVTGTKDSIAGTVYWLDEGVSYRRGGFVDVKTTGDQAKLTV
ncbi:hypothetical protein BV22DRAFT_185964 [Leucogyrophana mollusca]|uniref:Uncharacterized protein n=1 Tax=Leucogyrophana mollusca TaxID=85980 RepID=A0ACB8BSQ8_9AGAM|nr:hypothetical protein BV22DRAFT_185964 [Leucogyrophana mollusca]